MAVSRDQTDTITEQLNMAIKYRIIGKRIGRKFYPYLTRREGIRLAAIAFGMDVAKLSCCASWIRKEMGL